MHVWQSIFCIWFPGKREIIWYFSHPYRMLEDIYEAFTERTEGTGTSITCICQTAGMTEQEREEFLACFDQEQDTTLVGFCVMGGIFSEGIDLTGEKLIGAAIIGTGLPQIGDEREILKNYYDNKGQAGFDYAYRYPGMNKVLQAAGRVIRNQGGQRSGIAFRREVSSESLQGTVSSGMAGL